MSKRKRKGARAVHAGDVLALAERIISVTENAGEKFVELKTALARLVLELAKRAPKPRSRPTMSGRDRVDEQMMILTARRRKAELIAEGTTKGKAADQAAEEAARSPFGKRRSLAASTIKRRMEDRR